MKKLGIFLAAGLITLPLSGHSAQTAQATLFCWSLRFHQGVDSFGDSTLDLYTNPSGTPNEELGAWYSTYTHRSHFALEFSGFPITGELYLDLPAFADANDNGFDDSFEVSQGVSGSSIGEYTTVLGGGNITASWSRGAGSKDGTCSLRLVDNTYGDLGTYWHTFEVLEYKGPLTYTPGSNTVSGSVNLTNAAGELQGPVSFTKSTTDPFNKLTLPSLFLTNAAQQTLSLFVPTDLFRDLRLRTNYYGEVEFNDGDPNTSAEDYYTWELSIDDLNDADHDGIPDFSDNPQSVAPPRRPLLSLTRGLTNLLLTIRGDVGHLHEIQEAGSVTSSNWQTVLSVTLTNDPQVVSLPLPASGINFWRAQAE